MTGLQRIIWIASYLKSGNTWMRLLLANVFADEGGVDINHVDRFTSSDVRQELFDRAAGRPFRAEQVEDWLAMRDKVRPALAASKPGHHFVKTHSMVGQVGPHHLIRPDVTAAAICMIRNPFDVLPSFARHMSCSLDETLEYMCEPDHLTTGPTGIAEMIGSWDRNVTSWTDASGLVRHVTRYEDMLADTEGEMRKVLAFLKVPVKDGKLRRAIRMSRFDKLRAQERKSGFKERPPGMDAFFATGKAGGWRDVLSPAQVARIRGAFLPVLERFYPELVAETGAIAEGAA